MRSSPRFDIAIVFTPRQRVDEIFRLGQPVQPIEELLATVSAVEQCRQALADICRDLVERGAR
jgi:hypothetical protein